MNEAFRQRVFLRMLLGQFMTPTIASPYVPISECSAGRTRVHMIYALELIQSLQLVSS